MVNGIVCNYDFNAFILPYHFIFYNYLSTTFQMTSPSTQYGLQAETPMDIDRLVEEISAALLECGDLVTRDPHYTHLAFSEPVSPTGFTTKKETVTTSSMACQQPIRWT